MRLTPFVLSLACIAAAHAANTTVTAVNMPAWIEHAGQSSHPLRPGMTLTSNDVIRTGQGARVLLTLPEGSQVKLGENANFRLENLNTSDGKRTPFSAVLDVVKGAFRFTTGVLGRHRERDVQIHVATVTAGIRGTDVWGKSDNDRDLVCLLDGKINVSHEGEAGAQIMDKPLSFFVAPKGKPANPIASVDADKVKNDWAPQTEPQAGQGLTKVGGTWKLAIATVETSIEALKWYETLQSAGYPAKVVELAPHKNQIRIEMLASKQDANTLGDRLQDTLHTTEVTVFQ